MGRSDDLRRRALTTLQEYEVLMRDGHFDYGNGYHGRDYLNPHRIFRHPSLIWRLAQDLIDVMPESLTSSTEVVAGPVMGGALLAHTIAGLIDGRRDLRGPSTDFAPFSHGDDGALLLRPFYRTVVAGKRVLLADDVRNTGKTLERSKAIVEAAGGTVVGSVQIFDRLEALVDLGVPNVALTEYRAAENYPAASCPMCARGVPVTTF